MASTEDSTDTHYLIQNRDEVETERLNFQHRIVQDCYNGFLIHPTIQPSTLTAIADVATGTGIWIEELRSQLSDGVNANTAPPRCDGFDISPGQFPKDGKATYVIQDILKPFPGEYHGIYDLVHVRFMFAALKKEQYVGAVQNLVALLKPGGHIQWTEFDFASLDPHSPLGTTLTRSIDLIISFFLSRGFDVYGSLAVVDALKAAGLQNVVREERNSYWMKDKGMSERVQQWVSMGLKTEIITSTLMTTGVADTKETASALAEKMVEEVEAEYRRGLVPVFPLRVVVGMKPL